MYISPYIVGGLVVLLGELVGLVIYSVHVVRRESRIAKEEERDDGDS